MIYEVTFYVMDQEIVVSVDFYDEFNRDVIIVKAVLQSQRRLESLSSVEEVTVVNTGKEAILE